MSRTIAFYHGMFPWLGIHLLEFDCDYRVEMRVLRGTKALGFPGIAAASIKTYNPRSYAGARASAYRLVRHPNVKAACSGFTRR